MALKRKTYVKEVKNCRLSIRHFRPVKKRAKAKNGCVPRKYKIKSRKSEGFLGCSI